MDSVLIAQMSGVSHYSSLTQAGKGVEIKIVAEIFLISLSLLSLMTQINLGLFITTKHKLLA